ncbi:hypothetical protein [Tessaracoccus sp.]
MSQLTVGTEHGPVLVVDAADHFRDALCNLILARGHLPAGITLDQKARYATRRFFQTAVTVNPDDPAGKVIQSAQIWVTSTTHPDHPGYTYGTTWLLLTHQGLPPVAIAFTVQAGNPRKRTPALAQTPTQFQFIRDLLPGTGTWLADPRSLPGRPVPWDVLARVHPLLVAAAGQPAPKTPPTPPQTGQPPSLTSVITWASAGIMNPATAKGFTRLGATPDGCLRAGVDTSNPDIVLSYFEAAHNKLAPMIEARSTGKPGRGGRPTWKRWRLAALDLAVDWSYWFTTPAEPDCGDRMYTPERDPIPIEYAQEAAAYGWTAGEAAQFWNVHKTVCPKCARATTPGTTAPHEGADLPLLGWAPMKVTGRDASRYMLAGFSPEDIRVWPWNGHPDPSTLAVSAALVGFDINLWDQVPAGNR